jgi:hypothetical protein
MGETGRKAQVARGRPRRGEAPAALPLLPRGEAPRAGASAARDPLWRPRALFWYIPACLLFFLMPPRAAPRVSGGAAPLSFRLSPRTFAKKQSAVMSPPSPSSPSPPGQISLQKLLRRMVWSFALSIAGSWGLILPRLHVLELAPARQASSLWLYLDLASLSLAILGILLALYHNSLLSPRLARLHDLGESRWGFS